MATTRSFFKLKSTKILFLLAILSSALVPFFFQGTAGASDFLSQYGASNVDELPNRLPDDRYRLIKPFDNNNFANPDGLDCYTTPPYYQGDCSTSSFGNRTTGNSHQYITLSKGSINDSVRDSDFHGGDWVDIAVYTRAPSSGPSLSFDVVERRIAEFGCTGFGLKLEYFFGDFGLTPQPISGGSEFQVNGCGSYPNGSLPKIPVGAFAPVIENGQRIGYRAVVRVSLTNLTPSDRQGSFHINLNGQGGLGYAKGTWVNTYPTNAANDHRVEYTFRPNCDVRQGQILFFGWDQADYPSSFQPNKPGVTLFKHGPSGTTPQQVRTYDSPGNGPNYRQINMSSEMFYGPEGDKKPYAFTVRFDGVRGGNGISFYYPAESAFSQLECPNKPPDNPGTTTPSCEQFSRMMQPHSWYRFAYIPKGIGYDPPLAKAAPSSSPRPSLDAAVWNDYGGIIRDDRWQRNSTGGLVEYKADYPNPRAQGWRVIVEKWQMEDTNGNGIIGAGDQWRFDSTQFDFNNCFAAEIDCSSIDVVENFTGAPDNSVRANNQFTVVMSLRNTGQMPLRNGFNLGVQVVGEDWAGAVQGTTVNGRYYIPLNLTAPNNIDTYTLTVAPVYYNRFFLGGTCSVPINTYMRYDFNANIKTELNDPESPSFATHSSELNQLGVDVNSTSTRSFFKKRDGVRSSTGFNGTQLPNPHTANFGSPRYTDVYNIPPADYILGDAYCMQLYLERGHGWRGPGESYINEGPVDVNDCDPGAQPDCPACTTAPPVINMPYVKSYGADVAAGGGFGESCSRTESRILSFIRPSGEHRPFDPGNPDHSDRSGSGSQTAAMATDDINGFPSVNMRETAPAASGLKGLIFGNDNNSSPSPGFDPFLGGNMGGNGWCATDFYGSTQFPDSSPQKEISNSTADLTLNSLTPDPQKQIVRNIGGGKINLNGGTSFNQKVAVYVDGDVSIKSNIVYQTNYAAGIQSIPNFTLIVRGNIYVDKDVTQLDGFYVAQPATGRPNTGRIYTCSNSDLPVTNPQDMFALCGADNNSTPARQLVFNGAVVAEKVVLNRTGKTLRDSRFREASGATNAAEVFNFSPEVYLSPPFFRPTGTATSGDYDYIAVLAPTL